MIIATYVSIVLLVRFEILSSTIVESLRSHSLNQDVTPQARLSIETLSPDNITAIGELVN